MAVSRPLARAVARAPSSAASSRGAGSSEKYHQLTLNFIQPSYSVTRTSVGQPSLSLNFVAGTYKVKN